MIARLARSGAAPPLAEGPAAERLASLRLWRSRGVGAATHARLLAEHGSALTALASLTDPCPEPVALAELRVGAAAGARLVAPGEAGYPVLLAEGEAPPPFLWAAGRVALAARPMVALVGTRTPSSLGVRMARALAADLGAAGLVVVSGFARGIDAEAHRAALGTGTVAILPTGIDGAGPAENGTLGAELRAEGLMLTALPPGTEPVAHQYLARNRLVAASALATVVVEAGERSGTMTTARAAAELGREVMAVPGHPLDPRAGGALALLRDGATPVRHAEDVLEALAPALAAWREPVMGLGEASAAWSGPSGGVAARMLERWRGGVTEASLLAALGVASP